MSKPDKLAGMRAVVALGCFLLAGSAAAQNPLQAGATLREELVLGAPGVRKVVALPAGDWEVLRVREYDGYRVRPNDYSNPPRMVDVALIQRDGGRMLMLLRVVTLREPINVVRWTQADPCDRTDTLHRNPYDSGVWDRTCLLVNHVPGFLKGASAAEFAEIRQWVAQHGVEVPATALYATFARLAPRENFRVQVWVNPALRNLDAAEPRWAANPFHRDWVQKDPARRRYVDEFIAWSENFTKRFLVQGAVNSGVVPAFR
jgi:hypothetical protein